MNKYTIFCTEEQTRKALELGAPIEFEVECPVNLETLERSPYPDIKMGKDGEPILIIPTAEQMLGWLDKQGVTFEVIMESKKIAYFTMWRIDDRGSRPIIGQSAYEKLMAAANKIVGK